MRMLAAVLIDAENIAPRSFDGLHHLLQNEARHSVSIVARLLVGNPQSLGSWSGIIHQHQFLAKTHQGGRNAADHLLQMEALALAQQGIQRFYLATNDGGFVPTVCQLRALGCHVFGFGNAHAARRLQASDDHFFRLDVAVPPVLAMTFLKPMGTFHHNTGGCMRSTNSWPLADHETTRESLQTVYGSAAQPPLLTGLLFLLLQHTLTALCLSPQESESMSSWSASEDAELLSTARHDPIIGFVLHQDASLRTTWQAVEAFAHRCHDAYQQGQMAAQHAFPHFPRHRVTALHHNHLAHLLSSWQYNPHAASEDAQATYPGYTPDMEQALLLRWFHRGYLAGALQNPDLPIERSPSEAPR